MWGTATVIMQAISIPRITPHIWEIDAGYDESCINGITPTHVGNRCLTVPVKLSQRITPTCVGNSDTFLFFGV